jgi:hypothetical protein
MRRRLPSFIALSFFASITSVQAASLTLEWDLPEQPGATGFIIHYGTAPGVHTVARQTGYVTRYRVDGLEYSQQYCFVVQAHDASGALSPLSSEVCAVTPEPPPPPPTWLESPAYTPPSAGSTGSVTAQASSGGGGDSGGSSSPPVGDVQSVPTSGAGSFQLTASLRNQRFVDLAWGSAPNGASQYRIEVGRAPGTTTTSTTTVSHADSIDLEPFGAGTYYVRARAVLGDTLGDVSTEAAVTVQTRLQSPQAVAATMVGRDAHVTWQMPADGVAATEFHVELGSASGVADVAVMRVAGLSATIRGIPDGTFYVRVRALRPEGLSEPSHEIRLQVAGGTPRCSAPPASPSVLRASAQGTLVTLSWQPGGGDPATSYVLFVGSAPGRRDLLTVPLGAATSLSAVAANGFYALQLVAVNGCGTSAWAAEAEVVVGPPAQAASAGPVPGAPVGLMQQVVGGTVTLSWSPPSGSPVTRYILEATTPAGPLAFDTGHAGTTFINHNTPSGRYTVRVRAANASGMGAASEVVVVVVP